MLGDTDLNKKFHLIGITITSNETTNAYRFTFNSIMVGAKKLFVVDVQPAALMCDADPAIHNGFRLAFGNDCPILMCYAHVMSNISRKYKFTDPARKEEFKNDVRVLHHSPCEELFDVGCELFENG